MGKYQLKQSQRFKAEHFNRREESFLEIKALQTFKLQPKYKQQPQTSVVYCVTTDSQLSVLVQTVKGLCFPASQSTDMNCAAVSQQAWVNGVMTSGRGY